MNFLSFLPNGWGKHKSGGEWAGPCPRCGGTDRFVVWPEHHSGKAGGKFLCRGCAPEGGDGIQFLRDFQGMSYREACEALRIEPRQGNGERRQEKRVWEPDPERFPSEAWQRQVASFLAECRGYLASDEGKTAIEGRDLSMDFALRHSLGWNPADRFENPEAWGMEPWRNDKGNPGKVYLPAGLVVPTFRKAGPVAVKIRRRDWQPDDKFPKYWAIKGGGNGALILGKAGLPVALVESELDALLIAQEAPDLCSVMALGSASNRPHAAATEFLKAAPVILVALDFDEPDAKGERAGTKAWRWWRESFTTAKRCPPATGKDPGEMHKDGVPVRVWIEAGLAEKAHQGTSYMPEPARSEAEPATALTLPAWTDLCPDYFMGCFTCPDAHLENLIGFCGRHDHAEGVPQ